MLPKIKKCFTAANSLDFLPIFPVSVVNKGKILWIGKRSKLSVMTIVPVLGERRFAWQKKKDESGATGESLRLDPASSSWKGSDGKTCLAVVPLR
jgi:hypothetical protein